MALAVSSWHDTTVIAIKQSARPPIRQALARTYKKVIEHFLLAERQIGQHSARLAAKYTRRLKGGQSTVAATLRETRDRFLYAPLGSWS
jgi:hypothetical protein